MKNKNNNENNKSKKILIIICVLLIIIGVFGIAFEAYQYYYALKISQETTKLSDSEGPASLADNPVDFSSLQSQNDEIYAWITVPGTNVDHPIVQSAKDDNFYLNHDAYKKEYNALGAVFTQSMNRKNFNDSVTVIYGHNGRNELYFNTLHRFQKKDFFDKQETFYIYLPERKLTYRIISAFKYDNRHILNSFDLSDTNVLSDFQQMLLNPKSMMVNKRENIELDINSKIVILSTCINDPSSRYLVCGVMIKDEQTK